MRYNRRNMRLKLEKILRDLESCREAEQHFCDPGLNEEMRNLRVAARNVIFRLSQ